MSDLGSQVLETALGLSFIFFLLSLAASGVQEAIAAAFRIRARMLERGIRDLLAESADSETDSAASDGEGGEQSQGEAPSASSREPARAIDVLDHPLVTRLTPQEPTGRFAGISRFLRGSRKTPSYLSPPTFALALFDTLAPDAGATGLLAKLETEINKRPEDDPFRRQLRPLLVKAEGSLDKLRTGVEEWFDDAMAHVSGWYKRRSQLIIGVIAVAAAVILNVDTIRIVDRLWEDDILRQGVAAAAVETAESEVASQGTGAEQGTTGQPAPASGEPPAGAIPPPPPGGPAAESYANEDDQVAAEIEDAANQVDTALDEVEGLQLPIGWNSENHFDFWSWEGLATIGGWLLTAFAVWFGAPFWFDALSRIARLRSTGPTPAPTGGGETGS